MGWALALEVPPRPGSTASRGPGSAFWTPSLIALAFLPDVASQGASALGVRDPTAATHSLVLAGAIAVLLAPALRHWGNLGWRSALLLGTLLVPGHVLLDLLQSPWRPLFWPLSLAPSGPPWPLLPRTAGAEALLSLGAFLAFLAMRRGRSPGASFLALLPSRPLAAGVTAAIVLLAGITHHVRGRREDSYKRALASLLAGDATTALRLADEADRWPEPTRPGRIEYLRGEAYEALRQPDEAERHLVLSLRADPGYFWARADLCVLLASSGRPREERRARTAPCLQELETRFAGHPDLARMAGKAQRALSHD